MVVRVPHHVCFVGRRHTNSIGILAALLFALGCSSDDPPQSANGGSGGSSSTNAGSGGSQAGSSNANGGSAGSAGTGEAGSAGAGEAGSAGAAAEDPSTPLEGNLCSGIGNGDPCLVVGTCSGRVCGLADLGSRNCVCGLDKVWDCTSCAFPMGDDQPSVLVPPGEGDAGALRACETTVARDVPCSPMGDRCALPDGDVCACWIVEDGVNVWDCDSPPSFWP